MLQKVLDNIPWKNFNGMHWEYQIAVQRDWKTLWFWYQIWILALDLVYIEFSSCTDKVSFLVISFLCFSLNAAKFGGLWADLAEKHRKNIPLLTKEFLACSWSIKIRVGNEKMLTLKTDTVFTLDSKYYGWDGTRAIYRKLITIS